MQINRHMTVPLLGFDDVSPVMGVPRGDLFKFGINPFNGNVVVSWQDNPTARFYIRLFLAQLSNYADIFDEDAISAFHRGEIALDDVSASPFIDVMEVV